MKKTGILFFLCISFAITACHNKESALEILQKTIDTIDTINTIYYKQDMWRSNPQNGDDTLFRFREMYFQRLALDSIVGVKGHWYLYVNDKEHIVYEDIYDGNKLVRKNNQDRIARIYDLVKFPDFKRKHFWGHNTLFGMQYEFKYMLSHLGSYKIVRRNDTIIDGKDCFQIGIQLENKITLPGFATELIEKKGSISTTLYCIDKQTYYPIRMKRERYSADHPKEKSFITQKYYDIKFNFVSDDHNQFNTSEESMKGFEKIEMKPE